MASTVRAAPPPRQEPKILPAVASKLVSIVILIGLSLTLFSYRNELTPLYGTAPVSLHLNKVVWVACIIGSFLPTPPLRLATLLGGALICLIPNTAYWVAALTARHGDPTWGPVITHVLVILPVLALGVGMVKGLQELPGQESSEGGPQQLIALPVCQTAIMSIQEVWPLISAARKVTNEQLALSIGSLTLVVWTLLPYLPDIFVPSVPASGAAPEPVEPPKTKRQRQNAATHKVPKKAETIPESPPPKPQRPSLLRLALLPLIPLAAQTFLRSPTLPKPLSSAYTHPSYPMRILSSVRSPYSGVVTVGEALPLPSTHPHANDTPHSLRYLRAGHSLLGGAWIGDMVGRSPVAHDVAGVPLGDSIYNAFVLQEGARLFVNPEREQGARALVIGLGTGVAASAFVQHGIDTTVVEIDEAVHEAARTYFGFPELGEDRLFLENVRPWLQERRAELEGSVGAISEAETANPSGIEPYDIVVHDCFSGGSLPSYLYTESLWNDTKAVMRPDGILAVGIYGQLDSDPSRAILHTLESVYGRCRGYSDTRNPSDDISALYNQSLNWVFFCSPSGELNLRQSRIEDFLGSPLRAIMLSTFRARETELAPVRELPEKGKEQYLLTDNQNMLGKWQEATALKHWKLIREVLPDVFWETY